MAAPITVDDLITGVRDSLDEENTETVSDATILRKLNQGARNLYHIVAKRYDQLFMSTSTFTTDGTDTLSIPDDAYARRIEFITINVGNREERLEKVAPNRLHKYNYINLNTNYPSVYTTRGNNIHLGPAPQSGLTGTIYYMRKPATLVESQGRIVDISTGTNTITVDTLGSNLSTDVDNLSAFVNIVDPETGLTKVSLQISSIDTTNKTITFKSSGLDRSTVYGKTIATSIPTTIGKDDYVAEIEGSCVLETLSDHSDYLLQYAVVEIRRALGLDTNADFAALKDLERHVETVWSGREQDRRVSNRNAHWLRPFTRGRYRGW